jgi:hypothetical protein
MDHFYNHLAHTLIIGPMLVLIGMNNTFLSEYLHLPEYSYKFILGLGLFVLGYHLYRAYKKISEKGFASAWVNYIHILLVAPVLIAIGYLGKDVPRYVRELCMMLGFAAIGYHGYYLFV